MIFTDLQEVTAYRMHKPVWAAAPTSGAGTGLHGGRVNRPGIDTLYLSLDSQTAISEYQQTSSLLPPGTLITYIVTTSRIVDFRNGYGKGWPALWQEFYCDWRRLWFGEHREPPSWQLWGSSLGTWGTRYFVLLDLFSGWTQSGSVHTAVEHR